MRAPLIVLEGIDGSGTTTQAELLVSRLDRDCGITAALTREPSRGPIGSLLREVLSGGRRLGSATVALLFAADRLDHVATVIEPALGTGQPVVTDRYVYSSLAYQSAELPLEWIARINQMAPSPDLAVYLRVSPDTAAKRRRSRGKPVELYDDDAVQLEVARRYDELLGDNPCAGTWRPDEAGMWRRLGPPRECLGRTVESAVLDGELSLDEVHSQLWTLVQMRLQLTS